MNVQEIAARVAPLWGLEIADIKGVRRDHRATEARQALVWLALVKARCSEGEVMTYLRRDTTSIYYSIGRLMVNMARDFSLYEKVVALDEEMNR